MFRVWGRTFKSNKMLQSTTNYVHFVIILTFAHGKALIIRVAKNNLKAVVNSRVFLTTPDLLVFYIFRRSGVLIRQRGIIYAYVQWQT